MYMDLKMKSDLNIMNQHASAWMNQYQTFGLWTVHCFCNISECRKWINLFGIEGVRCTILTCFRCVCLSCLVGGVALRVGN